MPRNTTKCQGAGEGRAGEKNGEGGARVSSGDMTYLALRK